MYANITATLQHETGRTETRKNCLSVKHSTHTDVIKVCSIEGNVAHTEYFDPLEWKIVKLSQTETPVTDWLDGICANITVTLQHETGRIEKIPNCRSVKTTDGNTIEIVVGINGKRYTEEYDSLSWEIKEARHTEKPPTER